MCLERISSLFKQMRQLPWRWCAVHALQKWPWWRCGAHVRALTLTLPRDTHRQIAGLDDWRPWTCDPDMGLACPRASASASI